MSGESAEQRAERARQIDAECDRFEDAWQAGAAPSLEEYVRRAPEEMRAELCRELLALERDYRRRSGRPVSATEARARLPALGPWAAAVLDELFADADVLVLQIEAGPCAGMSLTLAGHATSELGRAAGLAASLPQDRFLSRTHLTIQADWPWARLVDLGSKTGTLLNGVRISTAELHDGDEIRAGSSTFRVRWHKTLERAASANPSPSDTGVAS